MPAVLLLVWPDLVATARHTATVCDRMDLRMAWEQRSLSSLGCPVFSFSSPNCVVLDPSEYPYSSQYQSSLSWGQNLSLSLSTLAPPSAAGTGTWAALWLLSAVQRWSLWWILSFLPSEHPLLYFPPPCPWGGSKCTETFPPSWHLPRMQVPILKFPLFFYSLSFVLPHSKEIGLPFWKSGFSLQRAEGVRKELFHMQINFWCICGEGGDRPILFFFHLGSPPQNRL